MQGRSIAFAKIVLWEQRSLTVNSPPPPKELVARFNFDSYTYLSTLAVYWQESSTIIHTYHNIFILSLHCCVENGGSNVLALAACKSRQWTARREREGGGGGRSDEAVAMLPRGGRAADDTTRGVGGGGTRRAGGGRLGERGGGGRRESILRQAGGRRQDDTTRWWGHMT